MRTPIIAGNWKMHKTVAEALELVKGLHYALSQSVNANNVEIVVAPPYTAINKVSEFLKDSFIDVAGQDLFWEDAGAFTGKISGMMLKEAGAKYVIVGHSEQRQYFHETNETVNKKLKAALKNALIPIFCVGEKLEEREAGNVDAVIRSQLIEGLDGLVEREVADLVIAYEPVWAIGTGKTATPEQADDVHRMIREIIAKNYNTDVADKLRILYGGSVKASNSKELLSLENIDGALVGGASLKVDDFVGIIQSL